GLIQSAPAVRGTTSAAFTVAGTFGAPSLDGSLDGAVQYESLPPASFRARASISRDEASLREIDARLADSSVRGAVKWTSASNNIDGTLTGSLPLKTLHEVAAAIPRTLP